MLTPSRILRWQSGEPTYTTLNVCHPHQNAGVCLISHTAALLFMLYNLTACLYCIASEQRATETQLVGRPIHGYPARTSEELGSGVDKRRRFSRADTQ